MNDNRRKRIQNALEILTEVRDEEQDAFDNLPDNFQYSQKGEDMEVNIQQLEEAIDALEYIFNQ